MTANVATQHHHGSHRPLFWPLDEPTRPAKVDAIIVPTARPVAYLKAAADTAMALGCPLVTLHSRKWTSAAGAVEYLDPAVDLIAIDVPEVTRLKLPEMETSQLLTGKIFERRTDVSVKRNLALALSNKLRWERIVFLDDDIRVPEPGDLSKAAGLLSAHSAVGLGIGGFPDNSMVCHAFRAVGGKQETFIGGGALAVAVRQNRSFFPNVYNEDWFFLLDGGKQLQSVARVGQVLQYPYDPYRPERARAEEFGDVLAEGVFWLLDQGKPASDGDLAHWSDFLVHRQEFIRQVQTMVRSRNSINSSIRTRMDEALTAALGRSRCITAELCMDFMKALADDQDRWERHLHNVRKFSTTAREEALNSLSKEGCPPLSWYTRTARSATAVAPSAAARRRRPADTSLPANRPVRVREPRILRPKSPALLLAGYTAAAGDPRPSGEGARSRAMVAGSVPAG